MRLPFHNRRDNPESQSTLPATESLAFDQELPERPLESSQSRRRASALAPMEVYATPPPSVGRSSSSPDSTKVEQQSYVPGPRSACLGQHIGDDDFQHYALHRLRQQTASAQSPPRSWNSPEQLWPSPWESATQEFQNRYSRLDPQLSGLRLRNDASYSSGIPTSFPADTLPMVPGQGFDGSDSGHQPSPRTGYPSTRDSVQPLSPCSSTLGLALEEDPPSPPGGADDLSDCQASHEAGAEGYSPYDKSNPKPAGGSGSKADGGNSKQEEPYAQLIHRAFLSTPRHAMTLQDIYQWFRENTDKGKDDNKGWQNSIRHNLSMNLAFIKRERRLSNGRDGGANGKGSNSGDSKKSTEWYLEPWAVSGVQSTTRYRKGNRSRRGHGGHSMPARGYRSYGVQQHSGRRRACGSGSGIQTGRIRGRSMPLPSSSSSGSANVAAATNAPTSAQLHQLPYHFATHHHQHRRQPQPFFDQHAQLLAATTTTTHAYPYPSYPYPYPFPSPSSSTTSNSNNTANANGTTLLDPAAADRTGPLDYDYDYDCDYNPYDCNYDYPALAAAGVPSEWATTGDEREPITPEPAGMLMLTAPVQQVPVTTLPPRLRGGGGQQAPLQEGAGMPVVVGVFDEVGGDRRVGMGMGMETEMDGWVAVGSGCVGVEEAGVYPPY